MNEIIKNIIWILIGFIIASLLAPMINPLITKIYLSIGLMKSPEVDVKIFKSPVKYALNEKVGGVVWQKGYAKYELILQNTGKSDIIIESAHLEVNFPGSIVSIIRGDISGGDCKIFAQRGAEITIEGKIYEKIETCHLVVDCKSLAPGDAAISSIIIDHQIRKDVTYFLCNPTNDYYGSYIWNKGGTPIRENIYGKIYGNEDELKAILVNYGIYTRKSGDLNQSIYYFDQCLSIDPNYTHALFHKGISLGEIGKNEENFDKIKEAFSLFNRTVTIDNRYKKAWNDMAVCKSILGDYEVSIGNIQNAIKEYEEAITYIDKAIAIDPSYKEAIDNKKLIQEKISKLSQG